MLLRLRVRLCKPTITTKPATPAPSQPPPNTKPMSPLPPAKTPSSPPTQPAPYHVTHRTSPPSHSTAYENFLLVLIATYLLWTLFYGFYILLRIGVWLFEQLELLLAHTMAKPINQRPMAYEIGTVTEMWVENRRQRGEVGKLPFVDSGVWIPVQRLDIPALRQVDRRRSGTV